MASSFEKPNNINPMVQAPSMTPNPAILCIGIANDRMANVVAKITAQMLRLMPIPNINRYVMEYTKTQPKREAMKLGIISLFE